MEPGETCLNCLLYVLSCLSMYMRLASFYLAGGFAGLMRILSFGCFCVSAISFPGAQSLNAVF